MAQQHFEEENHISYATFLFVLLLAFFLGIQLGGWHVRKHIKPCNCTIHDIHIPPKELPKYEAHTVENIAEFEVFTNAHGQRKINI